MIKKLRHKIIPRILVRLGQKILQILLWTCRIQVEGLENFLSTAEKGACVLMLWHDRLALVGPLGWKYGAHLTYAAFVSASRDGRLVNEICESYPHCRVISVSHTSRHLALRELIQQLKHRQEVLLITPDGPRGPRHVVKPGIALAARLAKAPVIPFAWSASCYWQLRTWDQMILPAPFSRVAVRFGSAVHVTDGLDEGYLEQQLALVTREACQQITPDETKWPK